MELSLNWASSLVFFLFANGSFIRFTDSTKLFSNSGDGNGSDAPHAEIGTQSIKHQNVACLRSPRRLDVLMTTSMLDALSRGEEDTNDHSLFIMIACPRKVSISVESCVTQSGPAQ